MSAPDAGLQKRIAAQMPMSQRQVEGIARASATWFAEMLDQYAADTYDQDDRIESAYAFAFGRAAHEVRECGGVS